MKSIIQTERECYLCGNPRVEEHHIFGGANRINSERYGLKVWLCRAHHTGDAGVHFNAELMRAMHKLGQKAFEDRYAECDDHGAFRAVFGKNYL